MKIIFEDPDFDIFDLDKFAFEDLVKDKYLLLNIESWADKVIDTFLDAPFLSKLPEYII